VLAAVRRANTEAKVSQRAEVAKLKVTSDAKTLTVLRTNIDDLRNAGALQEIEYIESSSDGESREITAQVTLAAPLN
jgi:valyl-tRNA synthetase